MYGKYGSNITPPTPPSLLRDGYRVQSHIVGGTNMSHVVVDTDDSFKILEDTRKEGRTPFKNPDELVNVLADAIAKDHLKKPLDAVSIGITGRVNYKNGELITSGLIKLPYHFRLIHFLKATLRDRHGITHLPIEMRHDAVVAARGALINYPDVKNAIFAIVGSGVGGALITEPEQGGKPTISTSEFAQVMDATSIFPKQNALVSREHNLSASSLVRRLKQRMSQGRFGKNDFGWKGSRQLGKLPMSSIRSDDRRLPKMIIHSSNWLPKEKREQASNLNVNDQQRAILDSIIDEWHDDVAKMAAQLFATHPDAEKFFLFSKTAQYLDLPKLQTQIEQYSGVIKVPKDFFVYVKDDEALRGAATVAEWIDPIAEAKKRMAEAAAKRTPFAWGTMTASLVAGALLGISGYLAWTSHHETKTRPQANRDRESSRYAKHKPLQH